MTMFDWDNTKYPRKWSEMSFDFKGMFAYHLSMMAMMVAGPAVAAAGKLGIAGAVIIGVGILSARRRIALGWHWRRPTASRIVRGAVGIGAVAIFLLSTQSSFSPYNPNFLAWYLAGMGIGLFGLLTALRVTYLAEDDFLADCKDPSLDEAPEGKPRDEQWKRNLRAAFTIAFLLVWLDGVGSFYLFGKSVRDGSPVPTASAPASLQDHDRVVYVSAAQKRLVDLMQGGMMAGIPAVMIAGLVLHFLVGVRLFPNMPTRDELFSRHRQ